MTAFVRKLFGLVLVLALVAGVLRGLDALPGWWLGLGRSGEAFDDIAPLERVVGRRLLRPAFFPDELAWPPARVVLDRRPPRAALFVFVRRADGAEALRLWQSVDEAASPPVPVGLVGLELFEAAVPLDTRIARLRSVRLPDGRVWDELGFVEAGRWVVVQSLLPAELTVRIADSLR